MVPSAEGYDTCETARRSGASCASGAAFAMSGDRDHPGSRLASSVAPPRATSPIENSWAGASNPVTNAKPSPVVEKIIADFASKKGINQRKISDQEIIERCVYPMINEGAKILEEGKAIRASDIDIVWINGYGWPVYRGGPMFYGDTIGLDKVLARMKEFEGQMGADFTPSKLLEKLVAEGKGFKDLK